MLDLLFEAAGSLIKDNLDSMGKVGYQALGCAAVFLIGIVLVFVLPSFWGFAAWGAFIVLYFHVALSKRCAICRARMGAVAYTWDLEVKGKKKKRQVCSTCHLELKSRQLGENPLTSWLPPPKQQVQDPSSGQ